MIETVLVIGYGYLGRRVAANFLARGIRVAATTRSIAKAAAMTGDGVEPFVYDVVDGDPSQLPVTDVVVHCVGFDRASNSTIESVYVEGAVRTFVGMSKPKRVVLVSSTGVYGDVDGKWVDETTVPGPTDESGHACLAAEIALGKLAATRGFDAVILRLAGIYGPGRELNAANLLAGRPIAANPEAHLNLVHVDDAADAVMLAAECAPANAIYNVSDGRPRRRGDFYDGLARSLGAPPPTFDATAAKRRRGDRKVANRKIIAELGATFERTPF